MVPPDDPNDPESDSGWQTKTQIIKPLERPASTGADCVVVIYTREGKGPLGKRVALDPTLDLVIGRDQGANLVLEFSSVSRSHARLQFRDGAWWVADNNSTNGTYVNDVLTREAPLRNGDRVKIGDVILKYLTGSDLEAEFMQTMSALVVTDELTRAHNKRFLLDQLDSELNRSARHGRPFSLIMFDIDYFKKINDTYGHVAGDYILKEVSTVVRRRIRTNESLCRYGGEEFAVLMPETETVGAAHLAQDVRSIIANHVFNFDNQRISVTISLGVAQWSPIIKTAEELIRLADAKLYQAKRDGRNRVCF